MKRKKYIREWNRGTNRNPKIYVQPVYDRGDTAGKVENYSYLIHIILVQVDIYMEKINHNPTVQHGEKSIPDKLKKLTWK